MLTTEHVKKSRLPSLRLQRDLLAGEPLEGGRGGVLLEDPSRFTSQCCAISHVSLHQFVSASPKIFISIYYTGLRNSDLQTPFCAVTPLQAHPCFISW